MITSGEPGSGEATLRLGQRDQGGRPSSEPRAQKKDWSPAEIEKYLINLPISEEMVTFIITTIREQLSNAEEVLRRAQDERAAAEALRMKVAAERAAIDRDREDARDRLNQAQLLLDEVRLRHVTARSRRRPARAVSDASGHALRPDPHSVQTPAALIRTLREFRMWAGNPSFRAMAQRCERRAGASTMCAVLGSDDLPERLGVIEAIIEGCGGSEEDRQRFATAWRRLAMPGTYQ